METSSEAPGDRPSLRIPAAEAPPDPRLSVAEGWMMGFFWTNPLTARVAPLLRWVGRLPLRYWRALVVLGVLYAHVLAFPFLHRMMGGDAPAFAVMLTIICGAFWGLRGGVLSAAAIFSLITLQLDVLERIGPLSDLYREGAPGGLALLLVGATVGRLRDLGDVVKRELARRQQAEAMAEAASRAKSEFLSRMSHELRTPLNSILGFAQLLEMDPLSPEQRESISYIVEGGQHLLALVNEVLDVSRIEAGQLTITLGPVPLASVLSDAVELIRPLAAERSIHVYANGVTTAAVVRADRQRLKQVVINLLTNAVKYNRSGGIVTVTCEQPSGGRVRISVQDTGRGIPAEQLGQVFVPFARPGAAESVVEGVGIGLALSRALVRLMGGELGVESVVGEGSTFWLELPAAERPADEAARDADEREVAEWEDRASSRRTVLYIEDDLAILDLLQHVLTNRMHVTLLTARQGWAGLDLARQHRPDLILMDVDLPDLTGEEFLHRLQTSPEGQAVPVVMMSEDAVSGQIERLLTLGARGFLPKPIDVKALLRVVDEAVVPATLGGGA